MLAAIHEQCFPNYWDARSFSNFFDVPATTAWIAQTHEPAGLVVNRVAGETADILTLGVLPRWRRQSLGFLLMNVAMQDARDKGATTMMLDVEEGNEAAIRLYQGFGFEQINRRKLYYKQKDGSYTDALVMTRKLV